MSGNEDDEVAEQFNLQDWCKAAGLTRKTEGTLSKKELTSLDALKMLEPVDLREMGLPIGQRKLLQQAVASLKVRSHCVRVRISFSIRFSFRVRRTIYTESEFLSVFDLILCPQLPRQTSKCDFV